VKMKNLRLFIFFSARGAKIIFRVSNFDDGKTYERIFHMREVVRRCACGFREQPLVSWGRFLISFISNLFDSIVLFLEVKCLF
jgi:hypothetical protein